jgi:hypothetical protein
MIFLKLLSCLFVAVLRIIAIQNEILNLQKGVSNGINFDQIAGE